MFRCQSKDSQTGIIVWWCQTLEDIAKVASVGEGVGRVVLVNFDGTTVAERADVGAVLRVGNLNRAVGEHAVAVVEGEDSRVGFISVGVSDEGSTFAAALVILQDVDVGDLTIRAEELLKASLIALEGKLSNEELRGSVGLRRGARGVLLRGLEGAGVGVQTEHTVWGI